MSIITELWDAFWVWLSIQTHFCGFIITSCWRNNYCSFMFLIASLLCLDRSTSQYSHNLYLQCYKDAFNLESLSLLANLAYLDFPLHRPPPEKLARVANSPHPLPRKKKIGLNFPMEETTPAHPPLPNRKTPPQYRFSALMRVALFHSNEYPFRALLYEFR